MVLQVQILTTGTEKYLFACFWVDFSTWLFVSGIEPKSYVLTGQFDNGIDKGR
jgi:hypothetical protein